MAIPQPIFKTYTPFYISTNRKNSFEPLTLIPNSNMFIDSLKILNRRYDEVLFINIFVVFIY